MNHKNLLQILGMFLLLFSSATFAGDNLAEREIAEFFDVSADRVHIECPQRSYNFTTEDNQTILNFCLDKVDQNKRCEVSIAGLDRSPDINEISYDLKIADITPRNLWQSVMQIHSFPDEGEKWRCPVLSLETVAGNFRSFNRWDVSPVSKTLGYNCAEAGSTISSRSVIDNVPIRPGEWQKIEFASRLSAQDGSLQLKVDEKDSGVLRGPNIFNDKKPPFLKFGIYKPAGFEKGHLKSCVKYKNVKISSKKIKEK